jgi:hypothetical protein
MENLMKSSKLTSAALSILVVFSLSTFAQSWYNGTGGYGLPYIFNNGGNVKVSGPRFSQNGDSAVLLLGDGMSNTKAKFGDGTYFNIWDNTTFNSAPIMCLKQSATLPGASGTANGAVGIGTTTPKSKLDVCGSVSYSAINCYGRTNITLTGADNVVIVNLNNTNIVLPNASDCKGRMYTLKAINSGTSFTVSAVAPNKIEYDKSIVTISAAGVSYPAPTCTLISDGSNIWWVINLIGKVS